MRPHDVVGGPTVLGNGGLTVGRGRDEHHVAGFGEGAPREESRHCIASGEPDRQRRHLEADVGGPSLVQQVADVVNRRRSPGPPLAQVPAFRPGERE